MAKGDTASQTPPTPPAASGGFGPQQNQTLQGNPSTDNQAQTRWMDPNSQSSDTGIAGGGTPGGKTSQPINNGTMLGQITAGSVGQYTPGGYDQGKFNDPNKHDPKYDIGRILSKYPPGQQGLDAAMSELEAQGFKRTGKDSITRADVGTIDVGKSFGSGDPNQMAWQWNPQAQMGQQQGGQQGSMLGQGNPQSQNDFLNQMFQAMQSRRNMFANQQFNPMGGQVPAGAPGGSDWTGGFNGGLGGTPIAGGTNPALIGQQQSMLQPMQPNQGNWNTWSTPGVPH